VAIGTGLRQGEVLGLRWSDIDLRTQRTQQARERLAAGSSWQDNDFVFATKDGRPLQWRSLDAAFDRAQERAGVRRQRFHDMRHAFATLLLDAGEEVAVISKMLGHADFSTTVDVYSDVSTERSRVAAARIDGLLKRRQVAEEIAQ
jgi:integrase